jgi:beta-lactamase class D
MMLNNVSIGAASKANIAGESIGGHAALAISGDETQAWFIGFVTLEDNRGAAIALVLENSDDASLAAEIAGRALQSAANSVRNQPETG